MLSTVLLWREVILNVIYCIGGVMVCRVRLDCGPQNENVNLLVRIKFLNLIYIHFYIYISK
jgi:hypothetical protein